MLNSSQLDMVFENDVFKEYLCTQNISVNELQQHLHEAIINVLENTMSKTAMMELAIMKGLHLKNSNSKRDIIQQLWNPMKESHKRKNTGECLNSKRRSSNERNDDYTCLFKWKNNKKVEKEYKQNTDNISESTEEVPMRNNIIIAQPEPEHEPLEYIQSIEFKGQLEHNVIEDDPTHTTEFKGQLEENVIEDDFSLDSVLTMQSDCCYLCNSSFELNACSKIHQFCEKYQKYTELRKANCVFDNFYSVWLPIDHTISNVHYEDINKRRSMIRNVALDNSIQMDSTGYCRYLQDINLYYPSLMSVTQKDALYFMNNHNVYPRTITNEMIILLPVNNVYMI